MTSLAEAENKFGRLVRGAGGAIFGIETAPSFGGRQEEKLQIGTLDGFVKMAVLLNQPSDMSESGPAVTSFSLPRASNFCDRSNGPTRSA